MSNPAKRFSRKNIDNILVDKTSTDFERSYTKFVIVPLLDFFPIFSAILLIHIYLNYNFLSSWLFILVFEFLVICSIYWMYVVFIKYYKIKVNHYSLKFEDIKKPFKFVFLSDIHIGRTYYGTNMKRARIIVEKINAQNLDLVIIGGDFICEDINNEMLMVLKDIKAKYKLAVYGNHDSDYQEENRVGRYPDELLDAVRKTGFEFLLNDGKNIELDGQKVYFGGIPDLYSRNFDVVKAFENAPKSGPKVLLSHNPDIIDFIEDSDDLDLILSGHTHSGMIYIKKLGLHFPIPTKYNWLTNGVFNVGKRTKLFLSQGIGYSGTRLRIGTDSEIAIITLTPR